ncbi:MAG: tryptophan synthase subunit alpha [Actinomycetota bacterium]|nr:tryptophan synthase subunit alpha [Actinomycetota bacterium]
MNKDNNSIIEKVFKDLRKNNKKAFIPFITCGFPSMEGFLELFRVLDGSGADIIEVGIPFSDPLADGPVIQETSRIALENGINTDIVFKYLLRARHISKKPIAIMTYFNTIYRYGVERFLKKSREAGVNGIIVPDLPLEEFKKYFKHFKEANIDNIMFASLTSSRERLMTVARKSKGFIYCISVKGVTGVRNNVNPEIIDFLKGMRGITKLPLALGFGLSNREQVSQIKDYCDGIIMGSKILSLVLEEDDFKDGIKAVESFASKINKILKTS